YSCHSAATRESRSPDQSNSRRCHPGSPPPKQMLSAPKCLTPAFSPRTTLLQQAPSHQEPEHPCSLEQWPKSLPSSRMSQEQSRVRRWPSARWEKIGLEWPPRIARELASFRCR